MKGKWQNILDIFTVIGLILILMGCSLGMPPATEPTTVITELPIEIPGVSPVPPAGDSIEFLSVDPLVAAGVSIADPVTIIVRYNMTIPEGTLQIWFERFSDPDCTITVADSTTGATTLAGSLDGGMPGGVQDITVYFPSLPLLETSYVGVGARLWTPDSSTILVEDASYEICYAVRPPPAGLHVAPSEGTGNGAISGIIFEDDNRNSLWETGEAGRGGETVVLADATCASPTTTALTGSTGFYAFSDLPAGAYCIVYSYTGGVVFPGYAQRVQVVAGSTSEASFAIQPSAAIIPSPPGTTSGYCGDGLLDTGVGEQCDPPNLTDCTASCQIYSGYCGDGYVDPALFEQCDPPNTTDCTASCQIYAGYCGDGYADPGLGEQCDPPNTTDCTASCQIYAGYCGDGYVDPGLGEQCDPPNTTNCTASCQNYP